MHDFHRLSRRMLSADDSIPVTCTAFDVVALDGESTMRRPYAERHPRRLRFWDAIVERGLEGVAAKREREPYRPGARLRMRTKNRATPRFAEEPAGSRRGR